MNNHSVISALLAARFEYLGVIDDNEPDYMELIEDLNFGLMDSN
jgi:hypothetical protein